MPSHVAIWGQASHAENSNYQGSVEETCLACLRSSKETSLRVTATRIKFYLDYVTSLFRILQWLPVSFWEIDKVLPMICSLGSYVISPPRTHCSHFLTVYMNCLHSDIFAHGLLEKTRLVYWLLFVVSGRVSLIQGHLRNRSRKYR